MQTRIVAGFPGIGKSTCVREMGGRALDSDSSKFSWIWDGSEKTRNPDFPSNYIDHIKESIGKYEYIFVSTHKEVREALHQSCLFFYLVYPPINAKEVYLERYQNRGSSPEFISLLSSHWEQWITELSTESRCTHVTMRSAFLCDVLDQQEFKS